MPGSTLKTPWGDPPWRIDFCSSVRPIPQEVDFGRNRRWIHRPFGCCLAAPIRTFKNCRPVRISHIGAGSSGHTGGITLAETAAGDLHRLRRLLAGFFGHRKRVGGGMRTFPSRCMGTWFEPPVCRDLRSHGRIPEICAWLSSPGGTVDPRKTCERLGALRRGAWRPDF